MNNLLKTADLQRLSKLVGNKFSYLAGSKLKHYLSAPSIFVVCETFAVKLFSDVREVLIEDYWESFSTIETNEPTSKEIKSCEDAGYIYSKFMGQDILEVFVIKESVISEMNGEVTFDYETDSGIVVVLTEGSITIKKPDHHIPVLKVTYAAGNVVPEIASTSSHFEEDLHQKYFWKRNVVSVENLLRGAED
jgi:hypothetical protein